MNHQDLNFHHIGVLTDNIERSKSELSDFGFIFIKDIFDPLQKVDLAFGNNSQNILLELVCPREGSKIQRLIKKNGVGPYHLCFEVSSILDFEPELKKRGYLCTLKPTKAIAFDNRLVSFFFSKNLGLIELLEK